MGAWQSYMQKKRRGPVSKIVTFVQFWMPNSQIAMDVRMKCIKKLEDNNEVELTPLADYAFYSKKYISGPDRL
jgi:hypothetical protein